SFGHTPACQQQLKRLTESISSTRLASDSDGTVKMNWGIATSTGCNKISLMQLTYKAIQQITTTLRLDEQDEDLKAFYSKLIVYCTIIESRLISFRETDFSPSSLVNLLSTPLERIFTDTFRRLLVSSWPLELAKLHGRIRSIKNNAAKIEILGIYLEIGSTSDVHDEIAKSLDFCENELRVRYPEDLSHWAFEDLAPQLSISEPTYAVWNAAQSIFKAMVSCMDCPCTPAHDLSARLFMGTYRKPEIQSNDKIDQVDFNMFLSSQQNWQEAIVHTTKEKKVQIVIDEPHGQRPKKECIRTMKVKSLCEPIAKINSKASYRLVFKVTRNQLFKLQSERSGKPIDNSQSAVSLDEFLRNRSGSLTEKTKRILAVILASAVFHLHNTPWLQSTWSSSDILFFRTPSSAIPLRPFIHRPLSSLHQTEEPISNDGTTLDSDDIDPDDIDPDDILSHDCPTLVILAIMLLELYFVAPFDILAQRFNINLEPDSQTTAFTRYMDVNYVFKACQKEIPNNSQFYLAVENCLDPKVWQDEEGRKLDEPTLRAKIYKSVVLPLETELSQAYGDVRIEDLDRIAQDIDFGCWGQPLKTRDQQSSTSNANGRVSVSADCPRQCSDVLPLRHQHTDENSRDSRALMDPPSNKRRCSRSPSGVESNGVLSELSSLPDVPSYSRSSYTVGILCALPLELLAVRALFDAKHDSPRYIRGDSNTYALGTLSNHMVVAACLPAGEYGTNAAADSASNMKRTYPNIEFCLLVGIGGGAPTQDNDIRLGDVVVSLPTTKYPGVIQYDLGKEIEGSTFELTGSLHRPPRCLMTAVSSLRSNPDLPSNALQSSLEEVTRRVPESWKAPATAAAYAKLLLGHTAANISDCENCVGLQLTCHAWLIRFLVRARDGEIRHKRGNYSVENPTQSWHMTMVIEPQISLSIFRLKETTRINVERILRWYLHLPSIEYCFTTILQHTRSPKESPARVILLVGRLGAGKSSIAEHATDTAGYQNDTKTLSTTDCEVLRTTIDGTEYFFIDTPGFHDDLSAVATFERISVLLNTINNHAVLVGLWYVVDITRSHTPLDTSVVDWIQRCLAIPPFPFLSIIFTDRGSKLPLKEIDHCFGQRMDILKELVDGGATILKYKTVYKDGVEIPEILKILDWNRQGRRCSSLQLRTMITRQYGNPSSIRIQRRNTSDSVSSAETQGRLRMFLFQTSLSFEDFSHSNSSTSDLDPFSDISSDDTPDVSDITTLPDILSVPFKFMSHLGIVAIQDEFFADKALSLRDKLATGKIYEHPGPYLKQSNDAFGRPVDTTFLNNITALGFIAYSNMDDTELDVLVQQLISVHGILHVRPVYHPIFWNSHDVACRFAYIAATPTSDLSRLRQLSTTFERAKFAFIREPKPKLPPIAIYSFFAKFLRLHNTRLHVFNSQSSVISRQASEGKMCADMVKLRFPILRYLNDVTEDDWNDLIFNCKISLWRWLEGGGSIKRPRARVGPNGAMCAMLVEHCT
ncbi:unnamed protein product, partial [Fusarium graminearum]